MIADKDTSGAIDFSEFMIYSFMLIQGDPDDKIKFVFQMIAYKKKSFSQRDLADFYKMIDERDFGVSSVLADLHKDELENLAEITFKKIPKSNPDFVTSAEFLQFCHSNSSNIKLFNFLKSAD